MSQPPSLRQWRSGYGTIVGFAVFVAVLLLPSPADMPAAAHRLAAVTGLMVVLWLTQSIPIAATSLLPLAFYPLLGILSARDVSAAYIDQSLFLFLGGFVIAIGIEKWGLHRRIALNLVRLTGTAPRRIVCGFMLATALLSMWISNTATTMLMLPIAAALLTAFESIQQPSLPADPRDERRQFQRFSVALMLGIAYSSSLGGLCTLVGTPTNIAYLGFWQTVAVEEPAFAGYELPSLGEWMIALVPFSLLMLAATAAWLTRGLNVSSPHRSQEFDRQQTPRDILNARLRELGRLSSGEYWMAVIFAVTALLWVTRKRLAFGDFVLIPGWSPYIEQFLVSRLGVPEQQASGSIHDSTVAMAMACLMFFIPVKTSDSDSDGDEPRRVEPLMDWQTAEYRLPWGTLLLIGGGFAMARGFTQTGLSDWLGESFAAAVSGWSTVWIVLGVCLLVTFLTEFTTNVATVSALLPVLAATALQLDLDPRLVMIPATISGSCAFMLPIATPPNAIVFASGRVDMRQMAGQGALLNFVGAALLTMMTLYWIAPVLQIGTG